MKPRKGFTPVAGEKKLGMGKAMFVLDCPERNYYDGKKDVIFPVFGVQGATDRYLAQKMILEEDEK